jgi:RHS repeat-associated protein
MQLWMRNADASNRPMRFYVDVETDAQRRLIMYRTIAVAAPFINGAGEIECRIGASYNDGEWQYLELDLEAAASAVSETVEQVNALYIYGNDYCVDDLVLGGGKLRRSRAVVPGAALGGVLGSWTGPNVVAEAGNRVRYFQYNDLGTVLAQTKSDGTLEGAWEPDHFGNYEGRYAYSGSPARPELGLTGKIYDPAAGAYYSGARWLDPERGRWLSEEPLGIDGPNLYFFVENDPINWIDPDGLTKSDNRCGLPDYFWDWYERSGEIQFFEWGPNIPCKEARKLFDQLKDQILAWSQKHGRLGTASKLGRFGRGASKWGKGLKLLVGFSFGSILTWADIIVLAPSAQAPGFPYPYPGPPDTSPPASPPDDCIDWALYY